MDVRLHHRSVHPQPTAPNDLPPPGQGHQLQEAEARQLGERLQAAFLTLSPSQREVLLLSRLAGVSQAEIAEVTGLSPTAVRVTLHRALRRLKELLGSL